MLIEGSVLGRFGPQDWTTQKYAISGDVLIFFASNSGQQVLTTLGWDKAHNYVLDLALTAGIPAAVFYLLFVATSLVALWRNESPWSLGSALVLIAFFVFGLAWFGTMSLDPIFWALVGVGLGFGTDQRGPGNQLGTIIDDGH